MDIGTVFEVVCVQGQPPQFDKKTAQSCQLVGLEAKGGWKCSIDERRKSMVTLTPRESVDERALPNHVKEYSLSGGGAENRSERKTNHIMCWGGHGQGEG